MRSFVVLTPILAAFAATGPAHGAYSNVALDAPVSLVAGTVSGAALSTLTDGVFRPRGTPWQSGTVWWNGMTTTFEIDLGRVWNIVGAIVQGDDNDAYRLLYRDLHTGAFMTLWDVPNYDGFGNGMQTRPNPMNHAEIYLFAGPVRTDAVRIQAISGDSANSLAEVQVFIPGPGVAGVLLAGLACTRRGR